jgi:hypothetical protein
MGTRKLKKGVNPEALKADALLKSLQRNIFLFPLAWKECLTLGIPHLREWHQRRGLPLNVPDNFPIADYLGLLPPTVIAAALVAADVACEAELNNVLRNWIRSLTKNEQKNVRNVFDSAKELTRNIEIYEKAYNSTQGVENS